MRPLRILSGFRLADRVRRSVFVGFVAAAALIAGTRAGGDLVANGDTRTLEIYHAHTQESVRITFKRNGQFDRDALEKLNWALRDWRRDEPTSMDPRLFDIVWEVHRSVGSEEPVHVVSAYRSPETNAMLRRRSSAVAKHSQHTRGKAMDFYLPDVSMQKVRDIALRLQRGGVGYYPTAYNPFVHLDAGSVRHWPRMNRDQLARVFPDGKTVHVPTDGKPMARYDEAYAEVVANGGTVFGASSYADAGETAPAATKSKGFFAWLFGGNEDEDEEVAKPRGRSRMVARNRGPVQSEPDDKPVVDTPIPQKPAPRVPSVVVAETRPSTAPMARSGQDMPQLVWQNGPAPLPPTGRLGMPATAPVTVAVLTSLANYKPADVPLPPSTDRPGTAPVVVAAAPLVGKAADVPMPTARPVEYRVAGVEPTVVGSVKSSGAVALPAVITGVPEKSLGTAVSAYAPAPAVFAPLPPARPQTAKAEPVNAEPAKAAAKIEPAKPDAKTEAVKVVPSKSVKSKSGDVLTTGSVAARPQLAPGMLAATPTATGGFVPPPGSLPTDRFGPAGTR